MDARDNRVVFVPSSKIPFFTYCIISFERYGTFSAENVDNDEKLAEFLLKYDKDQMGELLKKAMNDEEFLKKFIARWNELNIRFDLENRPLYKYRRDCLPKSLGLRFSSPFEFNDVFEFGGACLNAGAEWSDSPFAREVPPCVLCLGAEEMDPYMWTYYGEGHKGHCLVLDFESIRKALKKKIKIGFVFVGCGAVEYKDISVALESVAERKSRDSSALYISSAFLKPDFLEREKEYRFVLFGRESCTIEPKIEKIELGIRNPIVIGMRSKTPMYSLEADLSSSKLIKLGCRISIDKTRL